jgi:hypothetical protein
MQHFELDRQALTLLRAMSGEFAERYIAEVMLPQLHTSAQAEGPSREHVFAALRNPYQFLRCFYAHYAFAKRGRDRRDLADIAVQALRRTTSPERITEFLQQDDAYSLWQEFVHICEERSRKPAEQLNRGLVAGIAELAQEVYRLDGVGSITDWILQGIERHRRIEPQFLRIVDIRGVGPKTTATVLRDIVFLADVEADVEHQDRLYLQPVDRWMRLMSSYVIPEVGLEDAADWIIAGKIAKCARHANVSGIRFNMGVSYFGVAVVQEPHRFAEHVKSLLPPGVRRVMQGGPKQQVSHSM